MPKPSISENLLKMQNSFAEVVAEQIQAERKRNDDHIKANWATMSRRDRPVYVHSLRESGHTQQEIADTVGMSQPSIAQYDKKYHQQVAAMSGVKASKETT
jgi:DNA-directed RNA polymerase specialized sigma subunit